MSKISLYIVDDCSDFFYYGGGRHLYNKYYYNPIPLLNEMLKVVKDANWFGDISLEDTDAKYLKNIQTRPKKDTIKFEILNNSVKVSCQVEYRQVEQGKRIIEKIVDGEKYQREEKYENVILDWRTLNSKKYGADIIRPYVYERKFFVTKVEINIEDVDEIILK